MNDTLLRDKRKIKAIHFPCENGTISVGGQVEEIRVCEVNGQMAPVAWFEVVQDGVVISRYNSAFIDGVEYVIARSKSEESDV